MNNIRRWIIVPLITAVCISGPTLTSGAPLTFDIQTTYSLPNGTTGNGTGSFQINTATSTVAGVLDPGIPQNGDTQWVWIPIVACLLLCFPAPLEGQQSLLDQSNGDIFGTMESSFGAAGSAIFTSHLSGNTAVIPCADIV